MITDLNRYSLPVGKVGYKKDELQVSLRIYGGRYGWTLGSACTPLTCEGTFAVQQIPLERIWLEMQTSSGRAAWSWFETDSERRDPEQTQGKTLGRTKKPTHVVSKRSIWRDTLADYGQLSLDDLMQFTCIQPPQKLYYRRLHTVIGMCFWFSLERIIIVLWRKMCKSSLTLHQRGFTPGT